MVTLNPTVLANPAHRAAGADIVELFGHAPNDCSPQALRVRKLKWCPFIGAKCTKRSRNKKVIYGVCSVSDGAKAKEPGSDVVICPQRFYADRYKVLAEIAHQVWGVSRDEFIIGGTLRDLRKRASSLARSVIAFGQSSGNEIHIKGDAQLNLDWVLQRYSTKDGILKPEDFVCVEVQSIDTTQNYHATRKAYMKLGSPQQELHIPNSSHGLNWANVHKRLMPQLIRKGNVAKAAKRCLGLFFVLPDTVFKKFEIVVGPVPTHSTFHKTHLSVVTYTLGQYVQPGSIREMAFTRIVNYKLKEISNAFIHYVAPDAPKKLEQLLAKMLCQNGTT